LKRKIYLFVVCLMFAKMSFAVTLTQNFDVHIGIFDAAQVVFQYQYDGLHFYTKADINTENLFDTLYPFKGRYESWGRVNNSKVLPENYQTKTQSRHHIRTKKILYNRQGIAYKRISTKDEKRGEAAIVNVPKTADAADLQSVFAELIMQFSKTGSCKLQKEIYDGKKYYRLISEDGETQKRYFDYNKTTYEAHLCSVYLENLKNNNDNILWDVSADKPINLWVKTDEQTKIPVVLEIGIDSTPLGALKVIPTTVEIK